MDRVQAMGGAVAAIESGYLKAQLVASHAARRQRVERGEDVVVGVNAFPATEPSPLTADLDGAVQVVDPGVEAAAVASVRAWRAARDATAEGRAAVDGGLRRLRDDAQAGANLMPATLACARAGVTTGEWAGVLREVFGEYRAPTGLGGALPAVAGAEGSSGGFPEHARELAAVRDAVRRTGTELGGRLRLLVGKPGLDGHSNGAEQVAVRARDVGFEVVYQGIRLTPAQIVAAAVAEDVHCVGLSVLSGAHLEVVPEVLRGLRSAGLDDVPVVVGGIVPDGDARTLLAQGVAAVFTPKDSGLTGVLGSIVEEIRRARGLPASLPTR
jgi:(2R)-ethylmalonyl-CoA mutase